MDGVARAQHLVDLGRYEQARDELTEYLTGFPEAVTGWCLLAVCELHTNQLHKAMLAADQALWLHPESDWALRLRANILSQQNYPGAAAEAATAAVSAEPNLWANHLTLAVVLLRGKEKAEAYRSAAHAVELAPHEPDAHVILGAAAEALGRKREARAAYREAVRLNPEHAGALNNLAIADLSGLRLGRGARRLVAGLRSDPGNKVLQRNLDFLVLRLLAWVRNIAWLSAALLVLSSLGLLPDTAWCRALAGALLLGGDALAILWMFRRLPAGALHHLRGLLLRLSSDERVFAFTVVGLQLVIVLVAFAWGGFGRSGPVPLWVVIVCVAAIVRLAAGSFSGDARRR